MNRVICESELRMDQAELLLELFRVAEGLSELHQDSHKMVTFKDIQGFLCTGQPQVSRRIAHLDKEKFVDVAQVGATSKAHANSWCVGINEKGRKNIRPVWENYRQFAKELFDEVNTKKRLIHYKVTQMILRALLPSRSDKFVDQKPSEPVENILITLKAARELDSSKIRNKLLADSNITMEEADILTDLYGAWRLGWTDPKADANGHVTMKKLEMSLVHGTPNRVMLSRRVNKLKDAELLEIEKNDTQSLSDSALLRVSEDGIKLIKPVWDRFQLLADSLFEKVSERERETHLEVNEAILNKLRPAWDRLN